MSSVNVQECKHNASLSLGAGSPNHAEAITAIEITMATEFLLESQAGRKLEEHEENEKKVWRPLIMRHDL